MRDLYLIRHTPVGVPPALCYGDTDVPLASTADDDIATAIARLPQVVRSAGQVYSSPSTRCLRLAQALAPQVDTDARLKEFHFGAWETQSWAHIPRAQIAIWSANIIAVRAPGGENFAELARRADACIDTLLARTRGDLVVVTHAGVIRALIATRIGVELERVVRFTIEHGSSTCLRMHAQHTELRYVNR